MKRARDTTALRAAIARRGISQHELARLVGCTQGTVSFVLAGRAVNNALARKIARAVKERVDELFQAADASSEQHNHQPRVAS